jgi:hypothetical protein
MEIFDEKIIAELGLEMHDLKETTLKNELIIEKVKSKLQRINYASDEIEVCFDSDYKIWCNEPNSTIKSREVILIIDSDISENILVIESEE